jgi:trehalose 6-phosphate phosphatase
MSASVIVAAAAPTLRSVDALALLATEPDRAALLLDVDGVLAPIVARPEDASAPDATRAELRRLAGRYALVACITGRASDVAREIVGVPELRYVGEHGLELEPSSAAYADRVHRFARATGWPDVEEKPRSAALHFRRAADPAAARSTLEGIAARAEAEGLRASFGRLVLDLLPPVEATKGTAVRRLLDESGLDRALYAGDDTTDLDGFAALDDLELAVRVAVVSSEGPPALRARADVVVESPEAFAALLGTL